ncbi:hypothetical protein HZA43_05900 [Candidatus Peregrinibacteria bacterium]|nr:hypothetical protein [Candidatus Peregrinibacteria bacterium]
MSSRIDSCHEKLVIEWTIPKNRPSAVVSREIAPAFAPYREALRKTLEKGLPPAHRHR